MRFAAKITITSANTAMPAKNGEELEEPRSLPSSKNDGRLERGNDGRDLERAVPIGCVRQTTWLSGVLLRNACRRPPCRGEARGGD
jgi:hypothetical protein